MLTKSFLAIFIIAIFVITVSFDDANAVVDPFFVFEWGSDGFGDSQFRDPTSIFVDSSDNVYTTDNGADNLQKFNKNGNFIFKAFGAPDFFDSLVAITADFGPSQE